MVGITKFADFERGGVELEKLEWVFIHNENTMGMERTINEQRASSDTELIRNGAEMKVGVDNTQHLEVTGEQMEMAREEMGHDMAARTESDNKRAEEVRESLDVAFQDQASTRLVSPGETAQDDGRMKAEEQLREIRKWNSSNAVLSREMERKSITTKSLVTAGVGGAAAVGASLAAGTAAAAAAPFLAVGAGVIAVGGVVWRGWKKFQEKRQEKKLLDKEFDLRQQLASPGRS